MPRNERVAVTTVESKKGESVKSIAEGFGLSARQLSLYNPNLKRLPSGNLAAGQTVLVPTEAVALAAAPVPDPAIERYSSQKTGTTHVVKSGETLGMIAAKYHTTRAALMHTNGLRRGIVFPGQSLVIRTEAGTREVASRQSGSHKEGESGKRRTKKPGRRDSGSRKS
jgi:LysM repeat protein